MSLIIDTSVIIATLLNEESKPRLIKLTKGEELIVPSSLHWEVGNALSALFKRNRVSISQIKDALKLYEQIPLKVIEPDLYKSLVIASKYSIYAYDAYFLECAVQMRFPLLTLDESLKRIAKTMEIKIIEV